MYRPEPDLHEVQAISPDPGEHARQVLTWYREGRIRLLDGRPQIDWAMRDPAAPDAPLNGPHQFNMNRPGSAWFLPVTDAAALGSGLVDLYATRRAYIADDLRDGRPAGNADLVADGRVQRPVALTSYEQGLLTNESFPIGCIVQNVRLAAEAMGLGTWCFSGHDADLLLGAKPDLSPGLGFEAAAPNPRAPSEAGRHKTFGIRDVKEATFVPGPRFATPQALVTEWYEQRHGPGAWADRGPANAIAAGRTPWRPENARQIFEHPDAEPPSWAWKAAERHISYCVDRYGQWPVTFNPMQAGFGITVHHVDTDFYDRHYRPGFITPAIRAHHQSAHRVRE